MYPKFENLTKGFLPKDMLFFVSMLFNVLGETAGCTVTG